MNPTTLTLAAFQKHIFDRYEKTDRQRGTPGTWLHFSEEVGELAGRQGRCVPRLEHAGRVPQLGGVRRLRQGRPARPVRVQLCAMVAQV